MHNILKWDFKGIVSSKKFKIMFAVMMAFGLLYIAISLINRVDSGYDGIMGSINFTTSLIYLSGAIFAGICISSAFQDRFIQSAVMAGNSRLSVILSKSAGYLASIALFCACPVLVASAVITVLIGFGQEVTVGIILNIIRIYFLSILINMATMSVCIPISFFIKNVGVSIGANVAVILLWNGAAQALITNEKTSELASFMTMGQSYLVYGEMSATGVIKAILVCLVTMMLAVGITYAKFRKEELK